MTPGDVFRLRDDAVEGKHPWVVLSPPLGHPPSVVIGNFTAYDPNKDQSCIVNQGEEPCLKKKSIFSYRDARVVEVATVSSLFANGELIPGGTLQPEILARIYEGAAATRLMPIDPLEALESLGLIPVI